MKPALQVIHERSPDLSYADYRYCFYRHLRRRYFFLSRHKAAMS